VIGLRLAKARASIRARNCRIGRIRWARSRRVGRVIGQTPRGAVLRPRHYPVNLIIGRR
jgi:hypothetical protein